jgi:hypothetical protein
MKNLREGLTEVEVSYYLNLDGEPLTCHPNVNFGQPNVGYGLASPTWFKRLSRGDNVSIGAAYRRSLVHKTFVFAEGEDDFGPYAGCAEDTFVPYFRSIINWYESMEIGAAFGTVYEAAKKPLGSYESFGVGLNPGHLIHTDEWSNTPFQEGSECSIRSGMLIQCDYMAVKGNPKLCVHAEDGIAVADKDLRDEIKALAPECFARIMARRDMMANQLGINIREEVLPLSDIQALLPVYGMEPSVVYAKG